MGNILTLGGWQELADCGRGRGMRRERGGGGGGGVRGERIGNGRRNGRGGDRGSGERGEAEGEGRKEGIVRRKMRDEVDGREVGRKEGHGRTTGDYWYYRPLRWCSAVSTRCLLSDGRWQHTLKLPTSSLHLSLPEVRSQGNASITRRLRLTQLKDVWRVR